MRGNAIPTVFENARGFLYGDLLSDELCKGRYHGNLILLGDPDSIDNETTERYPAVMEKLLKRYGRKGYDDPEKFHCLLTEMGIFDRNSYDRDCAIAFSPELELLGAGRYVEGVDTRKLKKSEAMRSAQEIKGGHINGRHLAGLHFSSQNPENAAVVMSESGGSIITFVGGDLDQDYSSIISRLQK